MKTRRAFTGPRSFESTNEHEQKAREGQSSIRVNSCAFVDSIFFEPAQQVRFEKCPGRNEQSLSRRQLLKFHRDAIPHRPRLAAQHAPNRIPRRHRSSSGNINAKAFPLLHRVIRNRRQSPGRHVPKRQIHPRILPGRNRVIDSMSPRLPGGRPTLKYPPIRWPPLALSLCDRFFQHC